MSTTVCIACDHFVMVTGEKRLIHMVGWRLRLGLDGNGQNWYTETVTLVTCIRVIPTHNFAMQFS